MQVSASLCETGVVLSLRQLSHVDRHAGAAQSWGPPSTSFPLHQVCLLSVGQLRCPSLLRSPAPHSLQPPIFCSTPTLVSCQRAPVRR